jgi:hypothetical protein
MGFWAEQHGRQLRIAATGTFIFSGLTLLATLQIFFLQDYKGYGDYTQYGIVGMIVGVLGLFVVAPEFMRLKGYENDLKEIMALSSSSEFSKRRADGDEAARILGGGHAEVWNSFLVEKGLKKRG